MSLVNDDELNTYAIGQTAILEAFNVNIDTGLPESPIGAQLFLEEPGGTEIELALTEDPEGHIFHNYRITGAAGVYFYRIITSDDAMERFFAVRASRFSAPLGPIPP